MPFMRLKTNKWSTCQIRFWKWQTKTLRQSLNKDIQSHNTKALNSNIHHNGLGNKQMKNKIGWLTQEKALLICFYRGAAAGIRKGRVVPNQRLCVSLSLLNSLSECRRHNRMGTEESPNLTNRLFVPCLNDTDLFRPNCSGHIDFIQSPHINTSHTASMSNTSSVSHISHRCYTF